MNESKEELTPGEIRKQAYLIALRLKNTGLDGEAIYARLEKQGIPEELAREVVSDTLIERKKEVVNQAESAYNFAWMRIGIGVVIGVISFFVTGNFFLPMAIIGGGIVSALLAKKKMDE